jgi:hypothetical protein
MAGKYDHIDFVPPKGVAAAAARGLELRQKAKKSNKGGLTGQQAGKLGIGSGVQRAVNLKNRSKLSPATVKQMLAFFQRHEKSSKIDAGKTALTDKGFQAWSLWGGNPGFSWARKIVNQMNAADAKARTKKKAARDSVVVGVIKTAQLNSLPLDIRASELHMLAKLADLAGQTQLADYFDNLLLNSRYASEELDDQDDMPDEVEVDESDLLTDEDDAILDDQPSGRDHSEEAYYEDQARETLRHTPAEEIAALMALGFEDLMILCHKQDIGRKIRLHLGDVDARIIVEIDKKTKAIQVLDGYGMALRDVPDGALRVLTYPGWMEDYTDIPGDPIRSWDRPRR